MVKAKNHKLGIKIYGKNFAGIIKTIKFARSFILK